jgi:hypothetical protein
VSTGISSHTRKRLWLRSGGRCAFPDCDEPLLEPIEGLDEDTVVGIECHIVPREDSPKVARSVSSLSSQERDGFTHLVERRHDYSNLVLMCTRHSRIIDNPHADFSVAAVIAMKRDHEAKIDARLSVSERQAGDIILRQAAIVDGWETQISLDEWQRWIGPLFGDGHPRMRKEYFDRLSEVRRWMFSRVWPGTAPALEQAFENFRYVTQDLQLTLEQYPHRVLRESGWIAPERFYNDSGWAQKIGDHARLDDMYEWYAFLLEDLALELTRAANLVCEAVRQTIDPRYRVDEGLVVLESGPYMDFMTRLHRPRYQTDEGWAPYHGLREFLRDRERRDEYRGTGNVPDGLRLPGESRFPV